MKKIWFAVLVLFVSVMLAGCQESDTLSFEVEVVDISGTILFNDNITFTEDNTLSIVSLIEEEIEFDYSVSDYGTFVNGIAGFYPTEYGVTFNYYFSLYVDDEMSMVGIDDLVLTDGMKISFVEMTILSEFEVEVLDLNGNVLTSTSILFNEYETYDTLDLIDQALDLDYTTYSIGTFVNGIASYYPTEYGVTYNYYFSLYVDDEISSIGIDDLVLADGMKISFKESTMLDETDIKVDQLIQSFIDNHLSTYLNSDVFEYNVLAAIKQLEISGYLSSIISVDSIPTAYDSMSRDTIANTFKMTVLEKAYGKNLDDTKTALSGFVANNPYDAASLLNALTMTDGSSTQIDLLINTLTTSTPAFMDADYAGMILLALAPYSDLLSTTQTITDMTTYIKTVLTETGIESWGSSNASSTAAVILGLISQGINPRGESYQTNDIDLIEALLTYEINGAYKWQLTDEQADMAFSTPQVFSALVAYKIYRDVYGNPAFNLFDF